jgi:hypothetical protein
VQHTESRRVQLFGSKKLRGAPDRRRHRSWPSRLDRVANWQLDALSRSEQRAAGEHADTGYADTDRPGLIKQPSIGPCRIISHQLRSC